MTIAEGTDEARLVKLSAAAERLRVSPATLRNWTRLGVIVPDAENPYRFLPETLAAFRRDGEKLTSRANKSRSRNRSFRGPYRAAAAAFHSLRLRLAEAMFLATLKRLAIAGEVELTEEFQPIRYRRESVRVVIVAWESRLSLKRPPAQARLFWDALPSMEPVESLGELYQALMSIGHRAVRGAYYTSTELVDAALEYGQGACNFLDPCCGSGRYLVRAAKLLDLVPEEICGIEFDPVAAELARVNLLLAFPDREFTPNVHRGDALSGRILKERYGSFELVATNPPWGAMGSGREESFSRFLRQALRFLAPDGKLSFLLPEAVLNVKTHAPLRKQLLEMCRIEAVTMLGRCFAGVFTPVIRLDAVNSPPDDEHSCRLVRPDGELLRRQCRWSDRDEYSIEPDITAEDLALLEKINHVPHRTLAGHAEWALGLVTGDNMRLLAKTSEPGSRPILRGREIRPNELLPVQCWLRPGELQQSAPERFFRTVPKIVYRFIAHRPVCAVDWEGMLTLNSANLLIPNLPGWTVELTARFLNSRLAGYWFLKRFAVRKVLRKDLERVPFPLLSASEAEALARLEGEEFEERLFAKFGLTSEERALVLRATQ